MPFAERRYACIVLWYQLVERKSKLLRKPRHLFLKLSSSSLRADTVLPLQWPILATDGKTQVKEIPLKEGQRIMISIYAANREKRIWGDDAEEWNPERWLTGLPASAPDARLPGVYSSM